MGIQRIDLAGSRPTATHRSAWNRTADRVMLGVCPLVLLLPPFAEAQSPEPTANPSPSSAALDSLDTTGDASLLFQEIPSIFGASKYEQKVTEAPASVSIVTAEEIRRYGYRTLADILRNARGFYTTDDRNYSYAGIRGFGRPGDLNSRLLILVDGFRVNDGVYNQGVIGFAFPVDVDLIDRVEIARGPSASLYGTSAFFGVVNIITKDGRQMHGATLSGSLGSFDTGDGSLTYGERFANGTDVIVSGTLSDSGGHDLFFPDFLDVNGGVAHGADYERSQRAFGKLRFDELTIHASYVSRTKGIPTAAFETVFNDPRTFTVDDRAQLGVAFDHRFDTGLVLTSRVAYDNISYEGEYYYVYDQRDDGTPILETNIDTSRTQRISSDVTLIKQLNDRHRLVTGAEYRNNFELSQNTWDLEVYLDDSRDSTVLGLYAQDEFSLTETLLVNAGLRYDRYGFGSTRSNTSPRVALIYSPFANTTFKALYGEAFRAPSAYELYYNDGTTLKAALRLDPELMRSTEAVVEQRFGMAWQLTGSVYQYAIDDLITQVVDPADETLVFRNVEQIRATGAELEIEGRTANDWVGRAGYGLQRAREHPSALALTNSPLHLAKLNLIVPLAGERVFAGAEGLYMSTRRTLTGRPAEASILLNVTVSTQSFLDGWDVSASIYNLLNERYGDPGSGAHLQDVIPRDGRHFRVRLRYNFGFR